MAHAPDITTTPDAPVWRQRYRCPQCPVELQPREGYWLVEFQRHCFDHALQALDEASQAARRYEDGLLKLEEFLADERFSWHDHARLFSREIVATALSHPRPSK